MDFFTFFILVIICAFIAVCLAMGAAVFIAALPVIAVVFGLWLLIFHTFAGIVFVGGCALVLAAAKAK